VTIIKDDIHLSVEGKDGKLSVDNTFADLDADLDIEMGKNASFHIDIRKFRPTISITNEPHVYIDIKRDDDVKKRSRIEVYVTFKF
jgi:hypothetical protein